jgi:hypothetical protein
VPEPVCPGAPLSLQRCQELRQRAVHLRQQNRFLHRQSDRLRSHSNDLLTIARFRLDGYRPRRKIGRPLLTLVS